MRQTLRRAWALGIVVMAARTPLLAQETPILPAAGTVPGLDSSRPPSLAPTLLVEGTFVPPRIATLVRGTRGGWYAVFHPEADSPSIPAMGLLPSVVLERVEALASQQGDRARLRLSGQVCTYRGRNYLVLATAAPPGGSPPAEAPTGEPVVEPDDPSVEELIRELETVRDEPRALQPAPPQEPDATLAGAEAAAPSQVALPDGQFLTRRRVRVVRLSGAWAAVFDSDAGSEPVDTPLYLAPCQNTERLEKRAAAAGDAATYEISGRLTAYRGRNWIIPTMFQAVRRGDLAPMQ